MNISKKLELAAKTKEKSFLNTIPIPRKQFMQLNAFAKKYKISKSKLIRLIIEDFIEGQSTED